jgi:hypothetical protein
MSVGKTPDIWQTLLTQLTCRDTSLIWSKCQLANQCQSLLTFYWHISYTDKVWHMRHSKMVLPIACLSMQNVPIMSCRTTCRRHVQLSWCGCANESNNEAAQALVCAIRRIEEIKKGLKSISHVCGERLVMAWLLGGSPWLYLVFLWPSEWEC